MPSSSNKTENVEARFNVVLNSLTMITSHPPPPITPHPFAPFHHLARLFNPDPSFTYIPPVPNLELHSAAAEGNVGLVHYALTHGQPINSVLHGVQPIHAAAAGGSVSAMRMLIERGADVNAPRLPRRYSNEKKRGAPALGAAGATPLHFAAANGHVKIVQMLLTCGAVPSKADKLGQTPSSLAEHNGHDEVVHVLQMWGQLKQRERGSTTASDSASRAGPSSDTMDSPDDLSSQPGYEPSRTGKERAFSIASAKSDGGAAVKVKKSLDSLLRKKNRSTSMASTDEPSPREGSRSTTPTFHLHTSIQLASSPEVFAPLHASPQQVPLDRVASGSSAPDLQRVWSTASGGSGCSYNAPAHREHRGSGSSHRPSLPSIIEKAAHPGAVLRAAMRRERDSQAIRFSPETPPLLEEPRHGLLRGRLRSNDSQLSSASSGGSAMQTAQAAARRYISRHNLSNLFKRSNSPPSRSPSPPSRRGTAPVNLDETNKGIDRLKRASLDLDVRNSYADVDDLPVPQSAPATQSRFFEDLTPAVPSTPPLQGAQAASDLGRRPRMSGGIIAPSPLVNEWARDSDSDSTQPQQGIRRAETEVIGKTPPPVTIIPSSPLSPGSNKSRSDILPSGMVPSPTSAPYRLGWEDRGTDMRKTATAGIRRETEQARDEVVLDDEAEEFHDALVNVDEAKRDAGEAPHTTSLEIAQINEGEEPSAKDDPTSTGEGDPQDETRDAPRPQGRFRGASIGSGTTESSRLATPPGSSIRVASIMSDDGGSERHYDTRLVSRPTEGKGSMIPPPLPHSIGDGRHRGISISSVSTTASGMAMSYIQTTSTPGTSLTPASALSITLGSGFPPVPEHEVAASRQAFHPVSRRKVSSRAEAADLVKQNEDDVLQLAQLPPSLDSSRSLAAQLAAYGESHAIEQEFAEQERRERKAARRVNSGAKNGTADESSSAGSFVSARSSPSGVSSARSSQVRLGQANPTALLLSTAPKSSIPSIDSIYDRRAAAYRQRLAALASAPPLLPSSRIQAKGRHGSAESWFMAATQEASSRTDGSYGSNSMRVSSMPIGQPHSGKKKHAYSTRFMPKDTPLSDKPFFGATSNGQTIPSFTPLRDTLSVPRTPRPPAPIADVVSTPSAGMGTMPPPPIHPSRLPPIAPIAGHPSTANFPAKSPSSYSASALSPNTNVRPTTQAHTGAPGTSPYVSTFSNRLAVPHDGGESDESEPEGRGYTVIENDWRGGHVVQQQEPFRRGRWNSLKGAIHIGRK